MKHSKKFSMLAIGAVAALALSGCAASDESSSGGTLSEYDLSGVSIAVGSKDFDEQLILGEMMVAAFEAAGAQVDNKVNLGGTNVARAALESGEIDIYMEYNGTGWTVHLGQSDPSFDPEVLTSTSLLQHARQSPHALPLCRARHSLPCGAVSLNT